jgi:hypothetical protein
MPYQFTLYRPREAWQDFCLSGHGISLSYRPGTENGYAMLGRVMKWCGMPDGEVHISGAGKDTIAHSLPSSAYLGELPIGFMTITREIYTLLCAPVKRSVTLIARDLATPDGQLTEAGIRVKAEYESRLQAEQEESATKLVWLTPGQLMAFEIVRDGKLRQWSDTHGKTKNFMVRSGWVEVIDNVPVITELGQQVWQKFIDKDKE